MVIGEKEVIIIFDKHQGIIYSASEVFSSENHAHYYRHMKENFCSPPSNGVSNASNIVHSVSYIFKINLFLINFNKVFYIFLTSIRDLMPSYFNTSIYICVCVCVCVCSLICAIIRIFLTKRIASFIK